MNTDTESERQKTSATDLASSALDTVVLSSE